MATTQRREALKVEIPKEDSPKLGRVGIIAVVGFAIGALWPTLAGVKLVPSAPVQAAAAPLAGEPVAPASAAGAASAAAPSVPAAPPPAPAQGPAVGALQVTSCRAKGDRRVESCDAIDFDRLARPRIQALGACEGVTGVSGVLSLGFELDFGSATVERIASGKSTTLRQNETDALIACARKEFAEIKLDDVKHEHEKYTVFYRVEFQPDSAAPHDAEEDEAAPDDVTVTPASGRATVSWDVALVRSAPSREGKVVARILSGTRVVVSGKNGDWYQIKYDAKGNAGWVYRTAIGM